MLVILYNPSCTFSISVGKVSFLFRRRRRRGLMYLTAGRHIWRGCRVQRLPGSGTLPLWLPIVWITRGYPGGNLPLWLPKVWITRGYPATLATHSMDYQRLPGWDPTTLATHSMFTRGYPKYSSDSLRLPIV